MTNLKGLENNFGIFLVPLVTPGPTRIEQLPSEIALTWIDERTLEMALSDNTTYKIPLVPAENIPGLVVRDGRGKVFSHGAGWGGAGGSAWKAPEDPAVQIGGKDEVSQKKRIQILLLVIILLHRM